MKKIYIVHSRIRAHTPQLTSLQSYQSIVITEILQSIISLYVVGSMNKRVLLEDMHLINTVCIAVYVSDIASVWFCILINVDSL